MKRFFFRGHNSNGIVQFFSRFMPVQRSSKSEAVSLRTRLGGCGNPVEIRKAIIASFKSRPLLSIFSLVLIILIPIYYLTVKFTNPASEAAWFDDTFQYRKAISITNTSGSNLTDFQVSISIGTSAPIATGKMKSDCSDIRITDQNGKLLPHWIEENNPGCNAVTDAKIWVKAPSIPTSGGILYVYYGNPNASNIADGNGVFEFFDDFSQDLNKWINVSNAPWSISSGILNLTTGSPYNYLTANKSISASEIAIEARIKSNHTTGQSHPGLFWHANNLSGISSHRNDHVYLRPHSYNTTSNIQSAYHNGGLATSSSFTGLFNFNTWHNVKIEIPSTNSVKFYRDDVNEANFGGQQYLSNTYTGIVGHDGSNMQWDNYRVRKIASTQPTTSISTTEEKSLGPVSYWKFDEGVGSTVYDSSSSKNNGVISEAIWQTEDQCISGKCLSFDGINDYARMSSSSPEFGTGNFTISLWAYFGDSLGQWQRLAGKKAIAGAAAGYSIYWGGDTGKIMWSTANGSSGNEYWTTQTFTKNTWHHIVMVRNSSDSRVGYFYVDGKRYEISTIPSMLDVSSPSQNFSIGAIPNGTLPFKGKIDDVKVYSYARTAAQIKADYNSGLARQSSSKGTLVGMGSPGASNLSNGLVGYWKMDETSAGTGSTAYDASGNNNNGIGIGSTGTTVSSGKFGNGRSFNGAGNVILVSDTNNTLDMPNDFTISFWVNPDSAGTKELVAKANQGNYEIWQSNRDLSVRVNGGNPIISASNIFTYGQWTYITVKYERSGGLVSIYQNGNYFSSGINTNAASINNSSLQIGAFSDGTSYPFSGKMDELRIYNRALSPKEVSDLYNYAPGPIGYWDFEEGVGSTAYDRSGNGNNSAFGVGNSAPVWTTGKFGKGLKFDGVNDYINSGNGSSLNPNNSITIEGWFYSNDWSKVYVPFVKSQQYSVHFHTSNNLYVDFYDAVGTRLYAGFSYASLGIVNSNWYYLSFTFDGSEVKIYVNGQYKNKATGGAGGLRGDQGGNLYIGSQGVSSYFYKGIIDDFKIYNYIRTPGQIIEDMNGGHALGGSPVGSQVGYWKMDEGYGTVLNNTGSGGTNMNGSLGTGGSAPTWSNDGQFGKALNFSNTNSYITLSGYSALNNSTSFSASAWVKSNDTSQDQTILSANPPFFLRISGGKFRIGLYTNSAWTFANGTINLESNTWYHLTLVYDGSSLKSYVNGILDVNTAKTGALVSFATTYVGRPIPAGEQYPFNGLIDEVKVYNAALTNDEVKIDYNHGQAMQMGSLSVNTGNTAPSNAASQEYCVPGDTVTCFPPVAEYKFEEGSGNTAQDSSGNNLNGSVGGGANWTNGKNGKGLNFSGTTQNVFISDNSILKPTTITVEAWFNTRNKILAGQRIVSKTEGSGYQLSINVNGVCPASSLCFIVNIGGSYYSASYLNSNLSNNVWYHAVGTYDGQIIKLYVNGILVNSTNQPGVITQAGYPFCIGNESNVSVCSGGGFNGKIDDVKVFNYARTPAQIAWDYNRGAPMAWWKMDECQGNVAHDSSSNRIDGVINVGAGGTQTSAGTCSTTGTAWGNGATGKNNSSLSFDGVDDNVQIGSNFGILPSYTISFWAKHNVANKMPFASMVTPAFYWFGDNSWYYTHGGAGAEFYYPKSVNIPYGTWGHFTVTYDGTNVSIYRNGIFEGARGSTGTANFSNGFFIGDWASSSTYRFNGQIDDVRIYNYSLTAEQVKQVYNGGAINFGPATGSP